MVVTVALMTGCSSSRSKGNLHLINGELVRTPNAPWRAYEAYLRGALAMEASPRRAGEAQLYFRRAATLDPDEVLLWTSYAEASFAIGDFVVGDVALKRALALDPTDAHAREMSSQRD